PAPRCDGNAADHPGPASARNRGAAIAPITVPDEHPRRPRRPAVGVPLPAGAARGYLCRDELSGATRARFPLTLPVNTSRVCDVHRRFFSLIRRGGTPAPIRTRVTVDAAALSRCSSAEARALIPRTLAESAKALPLGVLKILGEDAICVAVADD